MLALPSGLVPPPRKQNNTPFYAFGLAARLMQANQPCVVCQINPGFTLKNKCENCAPLQEVFDTAFGLLQMREKPVKDRPGYFEAGYAGLDQLEAALITLARHLGVEQRMFFPTNLAPAQPAFVHEPVTLTADKQG
jgi:hypothetical protein